MTRVRAFSRVLLLAAVPGVAAQPAEIGGLRSVLDTLVPSLLAQYRVPGAAIAVVRNGALAWSQGYGLADLFDRLDAAEQV